uniref:Rho-GAP domain-containing protein n=1 Tax=Anopheles merus TaxID=30066 RepID=A0A182UN74_ANOME
MKRQLEKFKEELKSNLSRIFMLVKIRPRLYQVGCALFYLQKHGNPTPVKEREEGEVKRKAAGLVTNRKPSRSSKAEKNADGLQEIEREVDRYKDILQNLNKRIATNVSAGQPQDAVAREKRCKKVPEFQLGQLMEESVKDLPTGLLKDVLDTCARVEKRIATEIVNNEVNVENSVSKNLNDIIERHLSTIQKQKRVVTKCHQEYETSRQKYDSAQRNSDQAGNQAKITQLKDDQEELHTKLEKERDLYESYMYELLAEEENIALFVKEYVKHQELYFTSVLREIQHTMRSMDGLFRRNNKQIFNTPLRDHLKATDRKIAYVIELCVCCLLEKGLYEEGLLRVGCASSKLRRMISAINANYVSPPLADKYCDPHVVAGVLKKYLRSLPDPLLTFEFYPDFVQAAQKPSDAQRKAAILDIVNQLPRENYDNLRYLTKFLSYLAEKNQENKMSPQNIAIVMSPNLLWSPNENENYMDQVNSTATVNTIVEALVADWAFFFDGEVNFYVSMTRDALFPDNGGFPVDKDQHVRSVPSAPGGDMMSRSMFVTSSTDRGQPTVAVTLTGGSSQDELRIGRGEGGGGGGGGVSHSRSSSHDTSLILINSHSNHNSGNNGGNSGGGGGGSTDQLKYRSQSNSSLSDHSSPPQEYSPKLPIRRKHNKQVAPTPPDNHHQHHGRGQREVNNKLQSTHYFKQLSGSGVTGCSSASGHSHNGDGAGDDGFASLQHHAYKQAQAEYDRQPMLRAESHDNLLKLKSTDKIPPPRPAAVSVDSQVLGKIKASGSGSTTTTITTKPKHSSTRKDKPEPVAVNHVDTLASSSVSATVPQGTPPLAMMESTGSLGSDVQSPVNPLPPSGNYVNNASSTATANTTSSSSTTTTTSLQHVPQSPRGIDPKIKRPQVPAPPPPVGRPKSSDSTDL